MKIPRRTKRLVFTLCVLFILLSSMGFAQNETSYHQISSFENHIHSRVKEVTDNCNTVEKLTEESFGTLPIGIAPNGCNGGTTIIVIDSAYSPEPGGWFFRAYASVVLPGSTNPIAFAAKNIAFNEGGISASTSTKLVLVSNHSVQVNPNLSIELLADGHNYIEFDCSGFKSINLKGNFVFSDGLLVPDSTRAQGKLNVTASFEINTVDLNNILMTVNITPFKIRGLNDISFEVRNATADFSDLANPAGFVFPQDYQQQFGPEIQLWRGFYLGDVNVEVKGLNKDPNRPLRVSARNLLIDDLGVSGLFSASNVISLDSGSANGWPMSIDQLSVKLMFNQVAGGSLAGSLLIPFLGADTLAYTAMAEHVDNNMNFKFSVATPSTKEFNTPFSAKVKIAEGSIISIEKRNGEFIPSALLHGEITIENSLAKFSGIRFEDLGLTSERPYITSGVFSTMSNKEDQNRSVGFPVRIDSVNLQVYQGEAAIGLAVSLNLMNKENKGFSAGTLVQVFAKVEETANAESGDELQHNRRQEWRFDRIKINDIRLAANTTALKLNGVLRIFDDHPIYGNGFMGSLSLAIPNIMDNPAKVSAYFGSKETFRYWHLDAYVPTNIPIPPAITLSGLMGGASYHMVRQQPFEPDFNEIDPQKMEANTAVQTEVAYLPDESVGLSLLAGVTLFIGNPNAINADALLEISFNEHGGMRYAKFSGSAFFFTNVKDRERTSGNAIVSAPVFANLNMLFDRVNRVFHANLKTYINVANVIRGTGPNNLVGEAVIHTDPKDWYIYIGRPSQMFGLDIAKLAIARTYFMIGTKIESLPPPPPEVQQIFNDIEAGLMRDENATASGRGFAAGAHFRVGYDSKDKLKPFFVTFTAGAGADIMLRDYGDAYCEGRSGPIGIDGWYASGQAYVFLNGRLGIKIRRGSFDIVRLGAAALLQAKLPNPTWMQGRLGGRYSILGGLVKGKFNVKFTVGEECEIINPGGDLNNIEVIADLKPDADAQDVNVFSAPQASFNTSLDTDFTLMDDSDKPVTYRIRLSEFTLKKENAPVQANVEWNSAKDVAILRTPEVLPQQSSLSISVKLFWEKRTGNTAWQPVKDENGAIIYEVRETSFVTGTAPDFIPEENVAYSYPVKNQYNFHVNEQGAGYVKLRMGQAYLFEQDETTWTFLAKFQKTSGEAIEVPMNYDIGSATARFEIPQALSKQAIYKISFIKRPEGMGAIDQNLERSETNVNTGEENETTVTSNSLEGTILQNVEKELYKSAVRTSQFGTFAEKWSTFTNATDQFDIATGNIAVIGKRGNISETFDEIELQGREGQTNALVQVIASPENEWMRNYISPLLYDEYPVDPNVQILWRDPEVLGIKPLKGVKLTNILGHYRLTDSNITAGSAPVNSGSVLFGYYLSWYGFNDFIDLRNQAAAKYLSTGSAPPAVSRLLSARSFTGLLRGSYPFEIIYTLPGTGQVTYRSQISIKY